MQIVKFRKCLKCMKIKNIAELKNEPNLNSLICVNADACNKESSKIEGDEDKFRSTNDGND